MIGEYIGRNFDMIKFFFLIKENLGEDSKSKFKFT